ncbi:hypothetical protein AB1Y20_000380 [Prymnesium parvum]|uniref:3-hydroxyisobutyrate dehydrogenase n=1 Tax=Prymnesium parvum TaxID=97485 RepID=A0AB34K7S3_PRYPA
MGPLALLAVLPALTAAYRPGARPLGAPRSPASPRRPPPLLMSPPPVGFIGLGIMGQGMARRLLSANIPLVVWTRNETLAARFQSEAAVPAAVEVASSPMAVVQACSRTYLMLPTPEACHELYHTELGVLAGVAEGKAIIDCATLRVEDMEALSEAVHRRGGLFVEAPVSGSKGPAATGQLIFMVAGDEAVYHAARPEWEAMGKTAIYCGEVGKATQLKLVVNMIMSTQLAALAEGLALGRKLGLDGSQLQSVLEQGAIASPMLKLKGPLMAEANYSPNFPLKYALKDLVFALEEARAATGLDEDDPELLPVSSAATSLYTEANENGLGDLDFAAVYETLIGHTFTE